MTGKPRSLADLGDNCTMADLRRAWAEQDGICLLRSERCRRRGRRELWQVWRYRPPTPPPTGPRCSYVVVVWWRNGWSADAPYYQRAEAMEQFRRRGRIFAALVPPLLGGDDGSGPAKVSP